MNTISKNQITAFELNLTAGNSKAGAKTWAKHIKSISLAESKTAHGFEGEWIKDSGALPEGEYIIIGGRGGSWKNSTSSYALVQVKDGAELDFKDGYQTFKGSNLLLIESDGKYSAQETTEILKEYPELAPAAQGVLLPLYYQYLRHTSKEPNAEASAADASFEI